MGKVEARLKELGIALPGVTTPAANYVPYVISGNTVYVSGQICTQDGKITHAGKVGREYDIQGGQAAARVCAINVIAVLNGACGGNLDRVKRCLKVGGFVNVTPEFTDMPLVVNGASDLMVQVFGDAGRHARTAVGVASLPRNVAVEVDAVFEIS